MKKHLQNINNFTGNIIIDNASKDLTEFLIYNLYLECKKPIILINQGVSFERVKKNFSFLNPSLKVEYLQESEEIYSSKSHSLLELARQNKTIKNIIDAKFDILFLDYRMILKKIPNINFFQETLILKSSMNFGYSQLIEKLIEYGFFRCETVFDFGEFAVRGFVIDIGILNGYIRLEFDGERIASISQFNPESQRKQEGGNLQQVEIFKIKHSVLKTNWEKDLKKLSINQQIPEINEIIADISNFGNLNLNAFLPLFHETTTSIINFLPTEIMFVKWSNLSQTLDFFISNAKDLHSMYKKNGRKFLPVEKIFFEKDEIINKLNPSVELTSYL